MNKLVLALGIVTMSFLGYSQNGLEKIIVEKYYVSTAADTIGSADYGKLPIGSVTYRVYADMLPGYRFQALYGNSDHPLKISTTTSFFNNIDRGATTANAIDSKQLKNNTVALDSWFSVGASATGQFGVLKTEDDGKINLLTLNTLLKNNALAMGIPLTEQDGNLAGSPESVTFVGINPANGIFDATSQQGDSFTTTDGAISALSGAKGPTTENRILIGQFTTDGIFTFELNIQIGTPTPGVSEKYVARNAKVGEKTIRTLILSDNDAPYVEITSPTNKAKIKSGIETTITANASDTDGSIKKVEFFEDDKSIGIDSISPYSMAYTPIDGSHKLIAIAYDNKNAKTTSSTVEILALNNFLPEISITAPKMARLEKVRIDATATDSDGTIKMVSFYIDSILVGKDSIAPFNFEWNTKLGKHFIYAVAMDDKGGKTSSNKETIEVITNIAPVVSIITPISNASFYTDSTIVINASASDADGEIKKVEFFVDDKSIGIDSVTPYTASYKAVAGNHFIIAVATDNQQTVTTSSSININVITNINPEVTIISPSTNSIIITGSTLVINATASDKNGNVTKVEFFVDGTSVGIDSITPYSANYIAVEGKHTIEAVATDNQKARTTSASINIEVKTNIEPEVAIITPTTNTKIITGSTLVINATASDANGNVKKVEFFVDGKSIGIDSVIPYTANYIGIAGKHIITAVATDNQKGVTTSTNVSIDVIDNQLPIINISNYFQTIYKSDVVKITANATDKDGTISEVEFFMDSLSIGVDQNAPYMIDWIASAGIHHVKAVAKDNNGGKTYSSIKMFDVKNYTAGIEEMTNTAFTVYPNPATSEVTFTLNQLGEATSIHYQLTDNIGKIVFEKTIPSTQSTEKQTIDIQHFEKGVYHLQLNVNGNSTSHKLIIE